MTSVCYPHKRKDDARPNVSFMASRFQLSLLVKLVHLDGYNNCTNRLSIKIERLHGDVEDLTTYPANATQSVLGRGSRVSPTTP
jgi:hypothetical protein